MSLLANLVSHWKLDEGFGGSTPDAYGTNTLAPVNAPVGFPSGKIGPARDFERDSSQHLWIASNATLQTGDVDFTLACWVNLESKPAGNQNIVGKWGTVGPEFTLYWGPDRFAFAVTTSGGTFVSVISNNFGAPSTGVWHYVVGWHDAANDQIGISVDAGTPNTVAHSGGVNSGSNDFRMGWAGNVGAGYLDGLLDEVSFWKRTLTSGERNLLYNGGAGRPFSLFGSDAPRRRRGGGPGPLGR